MEGSLILGICSSKKSDITVYKLQTPVVDGVWIPDVLLGMMGGGKHERMG